MSLPKCLTRNYSNFRALNSFSSLRTFSSKTVNTEGPYKVVKGRGTHKREETYLAWRDPNFDILASKNFPFFMPGNVGPAWYDTITTIRNEGKFVMKKLEHNNDADLICRVQECPKVLRKTVSDLFPHRNLESSELSVITITIKPDLCSLRKNVDTETEKLAQTFVLAAKNVCTMLRKVGYWADFVNPFSGRPYFSTSVGDALYNNDEKFRCLDFQIFEIEKCLIVSNEEDRTKNKFIGSLFTNAPPQKNLLNEIFSK